jgi:hypothetical protein
VIVEAKLLTIDPSDQSISSLRRDLELDRTLRLALDDASSRSNVHAMRNVADPQPNQIACPQLTVDCEVKERQLPAIALELKPDSNRPDLLEL